jgi:hypothetical protein
MVEIAPHSAAATPLHDRARRTVAGLDRHVQDDLGPEPIL